MAATRVTGVVVFGAVGGTEFAPRYAS
jgi:hypothetical protein